MSVWDRIGIFVKARHRCLGSGSAAAMAVRAACSGIKIKENMHHVLSIAKLSGPHITLTHVALAGLTIHSIKL